MIYTYNGMLFWPKKKGSFGTCYDVNDPWGHYAKSPGVPWLPSDWGFDIVTAVAWVQSLAWEFLPSVGETKKKKKAKSKQFHLD